MDYKKEFVQLYNEYFWADKTADDFKDADITAWKSLCAFMHFVHQRHGLCAKVDPDVNYVKLYRSTIAIPDYGDKCLHVYTVRGTHLFTVAGTELPSEWTGMSRCAEIPGSGPLLTEQTVHSVPKLVEVSKGRYVNVWRGALKTPENFGCVHLLGGVWRLKDR